MNFKKTIAKSLVVAMALGMVPVANLQTAKAALTGVELNGTTGIATLKGVAENAAAYWGVAKLASKAGKDTVKIDNKDYKITNIQEYLKEIDVYALLKGKGGFIAGGETATPNNNWKVLEIKPADVLQVQYAATNKGFKGFAEAQTKAVGGDFGYLLATQKDGKTLKAIDFDDKIEVKLNDGNWQSVTKLFGGTGSDNVNPKLKVYGQNGSTLTFRIAGIAASDSAKGAWASKESKVKIPTQAKAPNVKVDVTKDNVAIKKGMEWQVVKIADNVATVPVAGKWTVAGDNVKSMDIKSLKVGGSGGTDLVVTDNHALFVRTAATDKKIASKHSMITLKARPTALKFADDKIDATGAKIKDSGEQEVGSINSVLSYDISKGAVLTNKSKNDWEYALAKETPTKWNTLKAPKDVNKPSTAKLSYSKTEKPNTFGWNGVKLYLRVAGTKQDKDGVAVLAGASVDKEVGLKNIDQALSFEDAILENVTNDSSNLSELKPKYKLEAGKAAKITLKAKITNVVKKDVAPKIKVTSGPKVSVKADKVNGDGKFNITIDISKNLFKTPDTIAPVKFELKFEGVTKEFTVELAKNA